MIDSRDPDKARLTPPDETRDELSRDSTAADESRTEEGSEPKDTPNAGESPLG
jgi:hypothetical protein